MCFLGHTTVTVMIDWITVKVPLKHSGVLCNGRIVKVTPDEQVDYEVRCWLSVEGSHSANLSVKTVEVDENGNGTVLMISGNPVKWFQGHNVFGTDDLGGLVYETMMRLCSIFHFEPSPDELRAWRRGDYTISRVDINGMYSLGCRRDVHAWLNTAQRSARTRMGVGILKGGTIYWGSNSSRWTLKAYSKGEEISRKGHMLPPELSLTSIADYADDKLRLELTLRQKELKKLGIEKGSAWEGFEVESLFDTYRDKLQMSHQKITSSRILDLPSCVRGTYQLWADGHDCRQILSDRTFYRHRNELRKQGIDISIPKTNVTQNVIPLIRVLEAIPVGVPDWAEGTNLYFEPRKRVGLQSVKSDSIISTKKKP